MGCAFYCLHGIYNFKSVMVSSMLVASRVGIEHFSKSAECIYSLFRERSPNLVALFGPTPTQNPLRERS